MIKAISRFLGAVLVSVSVVLVLADFHVWHEQAKYEHAKAMAIASVHELMAKDESSLCSAVTIAEDYAVTAAHCAENAVGGYLVVDGKNLPVASYAISKDQKDSMVIKVPGLKCPCTPVFDDKVNPINIGERLYAVGFPYGLMEVFTEGEIQGFAKIWMPPQAMIMEVPPDEIFLVSTTPVLPGNSGGGDFIFRDGIAYLVGVTSRGGGTLILSSVVDKVRLATLMKEADQNGVQRK